MPGFLTHWHILIETARNSQDAGNSIGSLIMDADALRRRAHGWSTPPQTTPAAAVWDTGPLPAMALHFPGSDISAMAFLGALAPDVMYYHRRYLHQKLTDAYLRNTPGPAPTKQRPTQWSELFHRSHSGDLPILFLEQVALIPSPALRSQALAFALGYISHIATDSTLNPWIHALATQIPLRRVTGPHCSWEFLLDEYLAITIFHHARYSPFHQPWYGYIEPAARNLNTPGAPTAQILQLLASAAEVYQLNENQTETLPADFLAGLQGLHRFLAGRGTARWLALLATPRKMLPEDLSTLLNTPLDEADPLPLEERLSYAIRSSEHLCRRAVHYYAALRNPQAEASERSSRRAALVNDLRNRDLYTGSMTDNDDHPSTSFAPHNQAPSTRAQGTGTQELFQRTGFIEQTG